MVSDMCSLRASARLLGLYKEHFLASVQSHSSDVLHFLWRSKRRERCNPWPHVANHHISISQLLSFWRHSRSPCSHYYVIRYWAGHAQCYGRTKVRTDALPRLIYNDSRRWRLIQRNVVAFASSVDWGRNYRNSILPCFQDIKCVLNVILINKQLL